MRINEVLTLAAFAFSAFPTHAQEAVIEKGKAIYVDHCAICHGDDGKGGGDLGKLLRTTPPDLTKMSEAVGGSFPMVAAFNVIVGGLVIPAHGGEGMPVWGRFFLEDAENNGISKWHAADIAAGRVLTLVYYLETIQE